MSQRPLANSNETSRLKDSIDLLGSAAKYGTFLIGGACLLLYSIEIGRFPEGVGLGEGLAFYLVCAGFLVVYSLYTFLCIAGGAIVLVWPVRHIQKRIKKRDEIYQDRFRWLVRTNFSSVVLDPMFVFIGLLSLALHFAYAYFQTHGAWHGWLFLLVPLVQAVGFFLFLVISRRYRHIESGLITDEDHQTPGVRREDLVFAKRIFFVWLVVAPMLVLPDRLFLVKAAFQLAQLRKDGATVHVKAPWASRLEQSSLVAKESFLGDEHRRFDGVDVLLRSVGDSVVIELPSASKRASLAVPKDSIYVE